MAKPFSVQCPNCDARLKIQNPQAVGKKVRCPNCQNPFTVEAPRTGRAKDDFDTDDNYDDDFGGNDDYDDDFGGGDDYDDDFGPPRAPARRSSSKSSASRSSSARSSSSKKSAKSAKPKKKSKRKSNNKAPLMIGGGVVAFLLLVGLGFLVFNLAGGGGGGLNKEDLAWLPPGTQVVMSIDVDEAWNSKVVQRFVNHPDLGELRTGIDEAKKKLAQAGFQEGESFDAIDSATLGFEKAGQDPLGVIRKKTAWNTEAFKSNQEFQEQTHEGKTYYKSFSNSVYFADDKTMILGSEQLVKDAITRGPTSNIADKFTFLPKGHFVMGGFPPAEDLEQMKQQITSNPMLTMGPAAEKKFIRDFIEGMKELQGGGMALTLGSGVELEMVAKCSSSGGAGKLSGAVGSMLADAKREINMNRGNLDKMPGQFKDIFEIAETLLNSTDTDSSGDTASLSMEVSSGSIDKIENLVKQAGGGGGFMPQIPGLDFGKMFGGGGGGPMGGGPALGGPLGNAREANERNQDKNNLKEIGIAMHNYHDTYRKLPGGGQSQLSWRVHILPFVEQKALYDQFHLNEPWNSPHNMALIPQMPQIYRRPGSNAAPGMTNYVGISNVGGMMENGGGKGFVDVRDGLSNTIMVTEVLDYAAVTWTQPIDYTFGLDNPMGDLGGFSGGFHALFGDGSVHFIPSTVDPQNLLALFLCSDGKVPLGL
jgi:predicted Zn finger-like uncharacterized protein